MATLPRASGGQQTFSPSALNEILGGLRLAGQSRAWRDDICYMNATYMLLIVDTTWNVGLRFTELFEARPAPTLRFGLGFYADELQLDVDQALLASGYTGPTPVADLGSVFMAVWDGGGLGAYAQAVDTVGMSLVRHGGVFAGSPALIKRISAGANISMLQYPELIEISANFPGGGPYAQSQPGVGVPLVFSEGLFGTTPAVLKRLKAGSNVLFNATDAHVEISLAFSPPDMTNYVTRSEYYPLRDDVLANAVFRRKHVVSDRDVTLLAPRVQLLDAQGVTTTLMVGSALDIIRGGLVGDGGPLVGNTLLTVAFSGTTFPKLSASSSIQTTSMQPDGFLSTGPCSFVLRGSTDATVLQLLSCSRRAGRATARAPRSWSRSGSRPTATTSSCGARPRWRGCRPRASRSRSSC